MSKQKMRTSQQKAQRAQMSILARILGCGYLVYIMVQLIQAALNEEEPTNTTAKLIIAVVLLLASLAVIVITALELVRNYKSGFYKSSAYTDDFDTVEDAPSIADGDAEIDDSDEDDGEDTDSD